MPVVKNVYKILLGKSPFVRHSFKKKKVRPLHFTTTFTKT